MLGLCKVLHRSQNENCVSVLALMNYFFTIYGVNERRQTYPCNGGISVHREKNNYNSNTHFSLQISQYVIQDKGDSRKLEIGWRRCYR